MIHLFLKKFIVKIFSSNGRVLSKRFSSFGRVDFSANTFVKKQSPRQNRAILGQMEEFDRRATRSPLYLYPVAIADRF